MVHILGSVEVFTFKEGLLSTVAHDLRLRFDRFEIELEGNAVRGRFWPDSLLVEGAVRNGKLDPASLTDNQKAEIHRNITRELLHTKRYPEVQFQGTAQAQASKIHCNGQLELAGRSHAVAFDLEEAAGAITGQVELKPTLWGIQPYRALLGAIRLQDRVLVRFNLSRGLT